MEPVKNPFKKKEAVAAPESPAPTPFVPKSKVIAKAASKAAVVEEMLREVQVEESKSKIHRTTLEIPAEVYEQIEAIRAETELSLKGFFMAAAKKYIAEYNAKK